MSNSPGNTSAYITLLMTSAVFVLNMKKKRWKPTTKFRSSTDLNTDDSNVDYENSGIISSETQLILDASSTIRFPWEPDEKEPHSNVPDLVTKSTPKQQDDFSFVASMNFANMHLRQPNCLCCR